MSEDQFSKLFKYMQDEFKLVNQKLDDKASASDMQMVLNLLNSIVKKQEISDDERLAMGHQLDRLDRWTHELATKIGYSLSV